MRSRVLCVQFSSEFGVSRTRNSADHLTPCDWSTQPGALLIINSVIFAFIIINQVTRTAGNVAFWLQGCKKWTWYGLLLWRHIYGDF